MLEPYYDPTYYPSSDDEPMGENDDICWLMTVSLDVLKRYFKTQKDVYISSNSFLYYVKGDPRQRVAPDLFVVKGVDSKPRPNFKIWEEGAVPQVVFEFTTESSRYKDLGLKKGLYEALGVKEYYLFDPVSEYLNPPFRCFELTEGALVEKPHKSSHFSHELQLTIRPQDKLLRFYPPDSLEPIPTSQELETFAESQVARAEVQAALADVEATRANTEAARVRELEEEVARLRAALEAQ